MPKYIKKPLTVEAIQWFKDGDHPEVRPDGYIPPLSAVAYAPEGFAKPKCACDTYKTGFYISTLEGKMRVIQGDWIVTGIHGEHYPVKDEIFKKTYKPFKAV